MTGLPPTSISMPRRTIFRPVLFFPAGVLAISAILASAAAPEESDADADAATACLLYAEDVLSLGGLLDARKNKSETGNTPSRDFVSPARFRRLSAFGSLLVVTGDIAGGKRSSIDGSCWVELEALEDFSSLLFDCFESVCF